VGTSEHWQIPHVINILLRLQPRSILDLGTGYGKFGVLSREYLKPERLDGIDAYKPRYDVYDHFYMGDLRDLDTLLPADSFRYDLALLIEVIEHLDKREALELLKRIGRRARRLLVTTPFGFRKQEFEGLPFATHRSRWFPWDFERAFRVQTMQIYPGHFSRHLRIPLMWQILCLIDFGAPSGAEAAARR